jgi:hypothetical protein
MPPVAFALLGERHRPGRPARIADERGASRPSQAHPMKEGLKPLLQTSSPGKEGRFPPPPSQTHPPLPGGRFMVTAAIGRSLEARPRRHRHPPSPLAHDGLVAVVDAWNSGATSASAPRGFPDPHDAVRDALDTSLFSPSPRRGPVRPCLHSHWRARAVATTSYAVTAPVVLTRASMLSPTLYPPSTRLCPARPIMGLG